MATSRLLFLFFSLVLFSNADSFNITKMLSQYPDFSTFNSYLTQAQLVSNINTRQTITVLAVSNDKISPIDGKPMDVIKKILSVHVVLDYYDVQKLQNLDNKTAILTTLFQASGQAIGQQGFLNVTLLTTGTVAFGSAISGSSLGSNLVKSIVSQPFNISVLQVSNVIMPQGIGNSNSSTSPSQSPNSSPPPPSASPSDSPNNAPAPKNAASPKTAPSPKASEAPAPSEANAPNDAVTPNADSPATPPPEADAPAADTPSADTPAAADGPAAAADAPAADADKSGGVSLASLGARVGLFASLGLSCLFAVTMT